MSLRLYTHDRHGRHANGDVRVTRARTPHVCGGYRCERRAIRPGDWYATATLYPGDDDFSFLNPGTWEPSTSAARLKLCTRCMNEADRDLIAAIECDLSGRASSGERFDAAFAQLLAADPEHAPGPTALNRVMGLNGRNKVNGRMSKRRIEMLTAAGFVKDHTERREGRWVRENGASS